MRFFSKVGAPIRVSTRSKPLIVDGENVIEGKLTDHELAIIFGLVKDGAITITEPYVDPSAMPAAAADATTAPTQPATPRAMRTRKRKAATPRGT